MESKARSGDTHIASIWKLKQENHYKFEAGLDYKILSQKIEKRANTMLLSGTS